ncbi:MAG TPA: hypothetical protein VKT77_20275 [Chthonomonadaceae bacterium]|nr:hypothetical protein [Chthonomonadaceae bacterium]
MNSVICRLARLLCASVALTAGIAGDVSVTAVYPCDVGPGPKDAPDGVGAVGPNHIVGFTDANVVILDKRSGKTVKKMSQTEFWKRVVKPGFDESRWNDPRMLYDPLCGRWFATHATDVGFLAVSDTSDPTKGWRGAHLPMEKTDPSIKMGVDRNGLYITYSVIRATTHTMGNLLAIPIADAIAPGGPSLANIQTFHDLEIDAFPATDLDPKKPADAPEVLLCHEFPINNATYSKLYMYRVTWAGKTASISPAQTISLSKTYYAPNASSSQSQAAQPAPGQKLRADEARRTTCAYAWNGSVFTCNGAKRTVGSRPGAFWCEVRAKDGELVQEGLVDDRDSDFLIPTLAVDATGDVGLGCTQSSETLFPSVAVMVHAASDPKGAMRPPVLAARGTTVFTSTRAGKYGIGWGNYNSTCVDPTDPTLFWTHQEYAADPAPDHYATCWTAFKLR